MGTPVVSYYPSARAPRRGVDYFPEHAVGEAIGILVVIAKLTWGVPTTGHRTAHGFRCRRRGCHGVGWHAADGGTLTGFARNTAKLEVVPPSLLGEGTMALFGQTTAMCRVRDWPPTGAERSASPSAVNCPRRPEP